MPGRVSARGARIALVLFVTVQAIVWSHSRYASVGGVGIRGTRHGHASGSAGTGLLADLGLVKRTATTSEPSVLPLFDGHNEVEEEVSVGSVLFCFYELCGHTL